MRAAIGARMAKSHAEIPAVTHPAKIGVTGLLALHARVNEGRETRFSVSNLGMCQVESFTPIINQLNAAIPGVCGIQDELAHVDGAVVVKKIMRTA